MTIAIAIILTGLMGALALTVSNLSGVGEAGARVVASGLAKEGIDVARNIRDTNWLGAASWDDGLFSGNDFTAIAVFDPLTNSWHLEFSPNAISEEAAKLYRDSNNLYLQDKTPPEGTATLYSRLVTLDPICLDPIAKTETIDGNPCGGGQQKIGIRVKSEVDWTEGGRPRSLVLEDRLYNWR